MVNIELQIHLFGPAQVFWRNYELNIPRRQPRALLYLLAEELQPVSRDQLCCIFWPDESEIQARRKLTRLITHLRRSLPEQDLVRTSGEFVYLDQRNVWVDTVAFESTVSAGSRPEISTLTEAVKLYRGPFLAGCQLPDTQGFDLWFSQRDRYWERRYLESLTSLIDIHAVQGNYAAAIDYAQQYLVLDSLAEDIHRKLIELYHASGNRSKALNQFEICLTTLQHELGVEPLPETLSVYQEALNGATTARPPVTQTMPESMPVGQAIPLLGREDQLTRLTQLLQRVQSGKGQFVLLYGEPGIGKTHLIREFIHRVQHRAEVLASSADPSSQSLPYHPIVQAFRQRAESFNPRSGVHPVWLADLGQLVPEVGQMHSHQLAPLPVELEETRTRLFEALSQALLSLATKLRPVLLCLDDLHWADSVTLEWLAYFGRNSANRSVLILGTCLVEESNRLKYLCQSLSKQGMLTEIQLEGLDQSAVLHLLQNMDRKTSNSLDLATRLMQVTGGNPFFITEILKGSVESGMALSDLQADPDLTLPPTVLQAINNRIERLAPITHQVLEAGAVLGDAFNFDLLSQTAGRSEVETMDSLDELLARQLLIEVGGVFRFHHILIQMAVYQSLSKWRSRLLHRRAGAAMQRLAPHDYTNLARHFELARLPGKAAQYHLAAGDRSKEIFAYREAKDSFDRALTLLEQECAVFLDPQELKTNQRLRIQALEGRGWAQRLLGDMDVYEDDLRQEKTLVQQLGDEQMLAHLRWREAVCHRWFCRFKSSVESAQNGLQLSQQVADVILQARCLREMGVSWRELGEFELGCQALDKALQLFEEAGETVLTIHTLGNLSTLSGHQGRLTHAMELAQKALDICDQHGLNFERRLPLGDLGAVAVEIGEFKDARHYLQESLSIALQIDDRTQKIFCLTHLGTLAMRRGHTSQALSYLLEALALAEKINSLNEQSRLHIDLAQVHLLINQPEEALPHANHALALANQQGRRPEAELASQILAGLT